MIDPRPSLPDDLDEIARDLPAGAPSGWGYLRSLFALLRPPLGTSPIGAGASELEDPGEVAQAAGLPDYYSGGAQGGGAVGTVPGSTIMPGSLPPGAFAAGIIPPRVVSSLPTLPDADYPQGSLVFLTSDQKLYRNTTGSTWERRIDGDADILANTITAGAIAAGAVGADEIAANAVTAVKIAAGEVTAEKLLVGEWTNALTNPGFEVNAGAGSGADPPGWAFQVSGTGTVAIAADGRASGGKWSVRMTAGSSGAAQIVSLPYIPSMPSELIAVSCMVFGSSSPTINLGIACYDSSFAYIGSVQENVPTSAAVWTQRSVSVVTLASTAYVRVNVSTTSAGGSWLDIDDIVIGRGGVTIGPGGIVIYDRYGATSLTASGFSENWEDFLSTGLYNGTFRNADATADTCPAWAKTNGTYAWDVIAKAGAVGGFAWRYPANGAAAGAESSILSDLTPVTGRFVYEAVASLAHDFVSGTPSINTQLTIFWYKADGVTACTPASNAGSYALGNADTSGHARSGTFVAPADAHYAKVKFGITNLANGVSNTDIESVSLIRSMTTDYYIPPGIIMLWHGQTTTIPNGWYLCDGSNGTPDLRDRFVIGADSTNEATTGGTASATASLGHPNDGSGSTGTLNLTTGAPNMAGGTVVATGSQQLIGHTHDADHGHNTPAHTHGAHAIYKHYLLCYIMKG